MIHFVFAENDLRFLFLKFDNKEDEKHLKNLKEHINLVDPICYLPTYKQHTNPKCIIKEES